MKKGTCRLAGFTAATSDRDRRKRNEAKKRRPSRRTSRFRDCDLVSLNLPIERRSVDAKTGCSNGEMPVRFVEDLEDREFLGFLERTGSIEVGGFDPTAQLRG